MKRTVIATEDNSKTLLINNTDVTYHSRHGAITESKHIFLEHGLKYFAGQESISVFEMGFGTGLNAVLSAQFALENQININYDSIEKYPIEANEIKELAVADNLTNEKLQLYFNNAHNCNWETKEEINTYFSLTKIDGDILEHNLPQENYDIVFFDAFGPKFQPELWQPNTLKKIFHSLKNEGILMTYCAQGQFKRDLKSVGFKVENLPGPPGKREITRAIKP